MRQVGIAQVVGARLHFLLTSSAKRQVAEAVFGSGL